jgi:hypothetical protein
MLRIEHTGVRAQLPDVSGLSILPVELRRVGPVAAAERFGDRVFVLGNSDDVDVIGHEAVGSDAQAVTSRVVIKKFAIEEVICVVEKDTEATDAPLSNMMR